MRLGAYTANLKAGSKVAEIYDATVIEERHRHRYEVDIKYRDQLETRASASRACRPTGGCRRSSRSPTTRGSSASSSTPSSSRSPSRRTRCSPTSCGPRRRWSGWSDRVARVTGGQQTPFPEIDQSNCDGDDVATAAGVAAVCVAEATAGRRDTHFRRQFRSDCPRFRRPAISAPFSARGRDSRKCHRAEEFRPAPAKKTCEDGCVAETAFPVTSLRIAARARVPGVAAGATSSEHPGRSPALAHLDIADRLAPPMRPQTSSTVERFNGRIATRAIAAERLRPGVSYRRRTCSIELASAGFFRLIYGRKLPLGPVLWHPAGASNT
jgi:hypothetical protein